MSSILTLAIRISPARRRFSLWPGVSLEEGIERTSVAICRGVRAVTRKRLLRRLGEAKDETLREVERALGMILGIDWQQRVGGTY